MTPEPAEPLKHEPFIYVAKTEDDIKEIAVGLLNNRYFTSAQCHDEPDTMRSVFMPLIFLRPEHLREMVEQNVNFIYEEYVKAGPLSVNGYPSFFSMKLLNVDDTKKVFKLYQELRDAQEKVLSGHSNQGDGPEGSNPPNG